MKIASILFWFVGRWFLFLDYFLVFLGNLFEDVVPG